MSLAPQQGRPFPPCALLGGGAHCGNGQKTRKWFKMQQTNPRSHEAFRAAVFISGVSSTLPFAGGLGRGPGAELEARRCAQGAAGDGAAGGCVPLQEQGSAQHRAVPGSGRRSSREMMPRALPDPCIAIPRPSVHGRRNTGELPLLGLTCILIHPHFPLI